MFQALCNIACFVTAFVCFLYATRIAWVSGKKCQFSTKSEDRIQTLLSSFPATIILYFIGFFILFGYPFDSYLARVVFSITSAIVLSNMMVSMAMPELKRKPTPMEAILVELLDGSVYQMAKRVLNDSLLKGTVAKFKRSDGWVVVGRDRLRAMNKEDLYNGVERRSDS